MKSLKERKKDRKREKENKETMKRTKKERKKERKKRNLLIDAMVLEECRLRKKNLNCTWVDVAKAYDSVRHNWLIRTLELHKISNAINNTVVKLSCQWKTSVRVKTQVGVRLTDPIQFKRGIYQGDTLWPLLFIMCVNPMAWKLRTLQGYRMTKPVDIDISHSFNLSMILSCILVQSDNTA